MAFAVAGGHSEVAMGARSAGWTSPPGQYQYVHGIGSAWCTAGNPGEKHAVAETVLAKPGQEFEIVLEGSPTTGFIWQLAHPLEKSGLVEVLGENIEPSTSLAGAPARQHFRFRAVTAGEMNLHFACRRPWEKKAPREQRQFVVKISP